MTHGLLQNRQRACTLVDFDGSSLPQSKAEEALQVAKKAALDWFGDDQMFSL